MGCGPKPKVTMAADTGAELTADELALLQDFHTWKVPVPLSQQPVKRVLLVLLKADGTSVQVFGTAYSTPASSWTNILLGFRYEGGVFVGRLWCRGPKTGVTYSFNFTNAATEHPRSWGRSGWEGNRAELATFWNSQEAVRRDSNDYNTLAVELVK
jgi:hypothetical protein